MSSFWGLTSCFGLTSYFGLGLKFSEYIVYSCCSCSALDECLFLRMTIFFFFFYGAVIVTRGNGAKFGTLAVFLYA